MPVGKGDFAKETAAGLSANLVALVIAPGAVAHGTEYATPLVPAPAAGYRTVIRWLDWVPNSTNKAMFQLLDGTGGTARFQGNAGSSGGNNFNNHKPNVNIQFAEATAVILSANDAALDLNIVISLQYATVEV